MEEDEGHSSDFYLGNLRKTKFRIENKVRILGLKTEFLEKKAESWENTFWILSLKTEPK